MVWLSSVFLVLLFLFNTLAIDPKQLFKISKSEWRQSLVTMTLIFLILPMMQAAAALTFLKDRDFALGVVVASCAPSALVIPFFSRLRGGNAPLALVNVVASSLMCPVMIVAVLYMTGLNSVFIDVRALGLYLFALTALPLLLSLILIWWRPKISATVAPSLPYLNSFLLAALMFILVGCSLNQFPIRLLWSGDLLPLLVFFALTEFGIYFAAHQCARLFIGSSDSETMALSLSTRNFAVSASLLLFFYPKAAIPSAIGLMIHAGFFQWLALNKKNDKAAN